MDQGSVLYLKWHTATQAYEATRLIPDPTDYVVAQPPHMSVVGSGISCSSYQRLYERDPE